MTLLTLQSDWTIQPVKNGRFGIFWNNQRCKDPMKQTGLGKAFKTPGAAALAMQLCKFDPLTDPR